MSNIIQLLPDSIANQIAAGEVIQRPASVIKELIENSIDADASKIEVIIKDAGKTLIQIVDNGKGMSEMDARMSFERHATSKIKNASDLFNLNTKGFRGEALASIAAISHIELKTKEKDAELGTLIEIEGSKICTSEPCTSEIGSSFSVKNLFYNVPARRNFLKSDSSETKHIIKEFQRVVLVHPEIHFTFTHNNKLLYDLPQSNLRIRIVNYFGKAFNLKLIPIKEELDLVKISGFIIKPEFSKKQMGDQFFFVNNRFFKHPKLHHAVIKAYEDLIPSKSYPGYFIFIEVPPHTIDVNVHPTKTEVKFEDDRSIYAILKATIKKSLGSNNISPSLDFSINKNFELPYNQKFKKVVEPQIKIDKSFNPFEIDKKKQFVSKNNNTIKPQKENWESFYQIKESKNIQNKELNFEDNQTITISSNADLKNEEPHTINKSNPIQINDSYILAPIKSGVILLDQHRAHRRILFEKLLDKLDNNEMLSQKLLFPEKIHLETNQLEIAKKFKQTLTQYGFDFELKNEHLILNGKPSISYSYKEINLLYDVIDSLAFCDDDNDKIKILLAKKMASSSAIKKGQNLNQEEIQKIVDELFACTNPSVTPEGNKIIHTINNHEIQNFF